MRFFILSVFLVYGGAHVYTFLRAQSALAFGPATGTALAAFMVLMVLAVFLIRTLEQYDYDIPARTLAYVAYLWMAVLFLFFCSSLVFDIAGLVIRASGWITHSNDSAYILSARTSFLVSLVLSFCICVYGYFEARTIRTERLTVKTKKLPDGIERLTIVQISDVHLGLIIRSDRLTKMLEIVNAAKPDILLSTGDLVDAQINRLVGLAALLHSVKTKYGNYAITGNHEYFAGIDRALAFTRDAGFTVLQNEAIPVGPITLAGVDDRTAVSMNLEKPISEKKLLASLPPERFTIFLKHQPSIDRATIGLFDLQLSGHTHKGQIFPFTLLTMIFFPLNAGTYDLGRSSLLHVSRGTGTWGPPIRFLSKPEITVIDLERMAAT